MLPSIEDIGPYLSERGVLEVQAAVDRLHIAALEQEKAALEARVAELEPADALEPDGLPPAVPTS